GGEPPRARAARLSRAAQPRDPSAGGALRRRAAAGRDRARGRQCAAHPARRRADRESRSADGRSCVQGAHAARARVWSRHALRHAEDGPWGPDGPAGDVAGRSGGGELAPGAIAETTALAWRKPPLDAANIT